LEIHSFVTCNAADTVNLTRQDKFSTC